MVVTTATAVKLEGVATNGGDHENCFYDSGTARDTDSGSGGGCGSESDSDSVSDYEGGASCAG